MLFSDTTPSEHLASVSTEVMNSYMANSRLTPNHHQVNSGTGREDVKRAGLRDNDHGRERER